MGCLTHRSRVGGAFLGGLQFRPMVAKPVRVSLLTLAVVAIQSQSLTVAADLPTSPGVGFPMAAIAEGQTARINPLNNGAGGPPLSGRVPGSCASGITFGFYSGDGKLLKENVVANLAPGKATFADLSYDELPKGVGRTQIRAVLQFGYAGATPPSAEMIKLMACNLLPSLEIFDSATGRTGIVLTETKPLPDPNPPRH